MRQEALRPSSDRRRPARRHNASLAELPLPELGRMPIVASWSIYLPVAAWLPVFRHARAGVVDGLDRLSREHGLHFHPPAPEDRRRTTAGAHSHWMFVGLVTGVYTFRLVGILLGPMVIGLLKALIDTVTRTSSRRMVDAGAGDVPESGASEMMS